MGAFLCALLLLVPSATAARIGPPTSTLDDWNFGRVCAGPSCTFTNVRLADANTRAPHGGTITRWRAHVGNLGGPAGLVRLQVLRRTVNEPGWAADEFSVIRESAEMEASVDDVYTFDTSLRIRKGDYIGLGAASASTEVFGRDEAPGNRYLDFVPMLEPGTAASTPGTSGENAARMLFNAKLR